jgi:hypothetical protein
MPDGEAADLFSARAAMIDPSFTADPTATHDIRSLCRRLDGLPLAVELAAAHVRLLPVREIERRLDDRFALLAKGKRSAPARHRTLRAVLDWSYTLTPGVWRSTHPPTTRISGTRRPSTRPGSPPVSSSPTTPCWLFAPMPTPSPTFGAATTKRPRPSAS